MQVGIWSVSFVLTIGMTLSARPSEAQECAANLIGAALASDQRAAQMAGQTQSVPADAVNTAANSYFATHGSSADYAAQLAAFHSEAPAWGGVTARIDGACPLGPNPSTAAVITWAADKWGISPQLMFAEATVESGWLQSADGDAGGSHGLFQVADRPANRPGGATHFFPGLENSMLAQESSCFNADYYAGHLYAVYHGLMTGQQTPPGNLTDAIQEWFSGFRSTGSGSYSAKVCSLVSGGDVIQASEGGGGMPTTPQSLLAGLLFLGAGAINGAANAQGITGPVPVITVPGSVTSDAPVEQSLTTGTAGDTYQPNTPFIQTLDQSLFQGVTTQNASTLMPVTTPLPCDSYTPMISQIAPALMNTYMGALNVAQQQETELQGEDFTTIAGNLQSPAELAATQGAGEAMLALVQQMRLLRQQMDTLIQVIATDKLHQLDSNVRALMPRHGSGC